jgi:hypothetical protein
MSAKKPDPDISTRFNYIVCIDIVVLACILVVAGRPDGLAITCSAIIIATGAVVYRCSMSVKSAMSGQSRRPQAGSRDDERASGQAARQAAVESPADSRASSRSWLRESE